MDKRSKTARNTRIRSAIKGIDQRLKGATTMLAGKTYEKRELLAMFQEELDATTAVEAATAARSKAVHRRNQLVKRNQAIYLALERFVRATFGEDPMVLDAFGFPPSKITKKTLDTKRHAALKAKATREARGTLGPKAKKKIKGAVPERG